jgi:hypothetical protein
VKGMFLSGSTGNDWIPFFLPIDITSETLDNARRAGLTLEHVLRDVLKSENLLVFCGLGTSLCLNDGKGDRAPTMQGLWDAAKAKAGSAFVKILKTAKYSLGDSGENIEALLSHCKLVQQFDPSKEVEEFLQETEKTIVDRCSFVQPDSPLSTHEVFLRKVARRSTRQPRMKLFTINYDLCFETAASHVRFGVIDGFSHTWPQEFDGSHFDLDFVRRNQDREAPDYVANVFQLYKIHGSVDWGMDGSQIVRMAKPERPVLVYPCHTKFEMSYDQPFIELMSRFQSALRQPNTGLVIIGYGFNDYHISQPLLSAIRSNVGLKVIVIDPAVEGSPNKCIQEIVGLIRRGDQRLCLVKTTFEDAVAGLPDLVATTEDEAHRGRVRDVKGTL